MCKSPFGEKKNIIFHFNWFGPTWPHLALLHQWGDLLFIPFNVLMWCFVQQCSHLWELRSVILVSIMGYLGWNPGHSEINQSFAFDFHEGRISSLLSVNVYSETVLSYGWGTLFYLAIQHQPHQSHTDAHAHVYIQNLLSSVFGFCVCVSDAVLSYLMGPRFLVYASCALSIWVR